MKYYFSQQTDRLTLTSYKEFEKECRSEEWEKYEAKILDLLKKDFNIQAVKIYLYRKEYGKALQFFKTHSGYSYYYNVNSEVFSVAKGLEVRYPTQILLFYKLSVGNLNVSTSRKVYSENAVAVARVRRVLVDVMKRPDEWKKYALPIKLNNIKRPAFQEEFSRIIPDWKNL
ncbi:MAG: hypothetical protein KKC46_08450 [Proteobacteria bacterium]|nr:hypothetical protein [Pseudomonadota bacterium]